MGEIEKDDRGREQVKRWYALAVMQNHEKVVRESLMQLAQTERWKDEIFRVFIPSLNEPNHRGKMVEKLIYPKTIFVEMKLNDDTYSAVKVAGVQHIIGNPSHIPDEQMKRVFDMSGVPFEEEEIAVQNGTRPVGSEATISSTEEGLFAGKTGIIASYNEEVDEYELQVTLNGELLSVFVKANQLQ